MNRFRSLSFQKKKETDTQNSKENAKGETQSANKPIKKKLGHSIKKKFFTSKSNQRSFSLDETKVNKLENKSKSKAIKERNSCIELESNLSENSELNHNDVFEQTECNRSNNLDNYHSNVEDGDHGNGTDSSLGQNDHHSNSTGDYFHVANNNKEKNYEHCDLASNCSNDNGNHDDDDVIYESNSVVQQTTLSLQQNNNNSDALRNNNDGTSSYLPSTTSPTADQFLATTSPLLPSSAHINRSSCIHHNLSNEFKRLAQQGWYWGPLTRCEAEEKLNLTPDGSFLVRDSSDDRYLLSLSFRSNDRTLHTRIEHSAGKFSFYEHNNTPTYSSVVDLIKDSVRDSQVGGVFCYSRPRDPLDRTYPVRLIHPVSRLAQVRSLKYLCRFLIRQYTRIDHIETLPLPNPVKGYLNLSYF